MRNLDLKDQGHSANSLHVFKDTLHTTGDKEFNLTLSLLSK